VVLLVQDAGDAAIGVENTNLGARPPLLRAAIGSRYRALDAVVTLTTGDAEEYRALLGARAPRLAAIPNTVRAIAGERADPEARTALAAGRLTPQKGFDLLIPAWAQVAAARPDWNLAICGRGERREQLAALVDQHGLQEHVALEPAAQDLAQRMRAASIYVLSSRFEGFPLVLLEAMAAGMAVVAFDCPTGPGEVIDDHRNGLLVPCKDVDALAAAILEMIEDDELRRTCADAALETAQEYTMEAIGPRWDALLAELQESHAR
jgi:glycosyltransferase involved in cell wall biosynthesis